MELDGTALVTGAGSGIGRATAVQIVKDGCRQILLVDLSLAGLEGTAEAIHNLEIRNFQVELQSCDISVEANVEQMVAEAVEKFGCLDYAVNCAGISSRGLMTAEETTANFDAIVSVNLRGLWLCGRYELKQMLKQQLKTPRHLETPKVRGSIVHIASQMGIVSWPRTGIYSATKAGVISLARSDAIDYAQEGIRINAVCPGSIDTPMNKDPTNKDVAPMKRLGRPEEVADAVTFLLSNRSSFITGHALLVDGGYVIN